jgi:hypothetical protein
MSGDRDQMARRALASLAPDELAEFHRLICLIADRSAGEALASGEAVADRASGEAG